MTQVDAAETLSERALREAYNSLSHYAEKNENVLYSMSLINAALAAPVASPPMQVKALDLDELAHKLTGLTNSLCCARTGGKGGPLMHPNCECRETAAEILSALVASPSREEVQITDATGWQDMATAPRDGKHCILAVKSGAFIYSVQGAFQNGQWNAVHCDNVEPLYWMPNVRLPAALRSLQSGEGE